MSPNLTIGLPVRNTAPFLEDALRSILAQTFSDWELVAVDDGSADDSAGILQRLKDPRVRVAVDGRHRGLGARLNQIISLAAGKYIARMDADDLMHPERLARQIEFLGQHPDVDVAGCGLISFDGRLRPMSVRRLPIEHDAIVSDPLSGIAVAHATAVARAEWWRKHPYNESIRGCEDWELWLASYRESRFANLAETLYFYREEQGYSFRGYVRDKAELASFLWRQQRRFGAAAALACAAQWTRIAAYSVAHCVGADRMLVKRRGTRPTISDTRLFEEAMTTISAVAL